jgi:hypothetical protein
MIAWLLTGNNLLNICMIIALSSFIISGILGFKDLTLEKHEIKVSKKSWIINILLLSNSLLFITGYILVSRYII